MTYILLIANYCMLIDVDKIFNVILGGSSTFPNHLAKFINLTIPNAIWSHPRHIWRVQITSLKKFRSLNPQILLTIMSACPHLLIPAELDRLHQILLVLDLAPSRSQ